MTPSRFRIGLVAAALALATACVTETGNPELQVGLEGVSSDPAVDLDRARRSAGLPVVLTEAWIHVDGIKLVQADRCDTPQETESEIDGPLLVDLRGEPTVAVARVEATDYCRVRLDIDRADGSGGAPAALADHSILIEGLIDGTTPFRIQSRWQDDLDLRSRGASFPLTDADEAIAIAFDLGAWLADLDLASGTPTNGTIVVDEGSNPALLSAFEANLEATVHDDEDRDGSAGEDEPILAD